MNLGVWFGLAFGATTAFGGLTPGEAESRGAVLSMLRMEKGIYAPALVVEVQGWHREGTLGIGIRPIGLTGRIGPLHLTVDGGIMGFSRDVPLPHTKKVVFTGDMMLHLTVDEFMAGVAFHHISNAGRASPNRGLNEIIFFVGRK